MTKCPSISISEVVGHIKLKFLMQGNGNGNGSENGCSSLRLTEQQVAKLMEEDMGSAMQYLQGKGLCLMPISLASAISSATSSSLLPHPAIRSMGDTGGSLHDGSSTASPPLVNGACGDDSRTIKDAGTGDKQWRWTISVLGRSYVQKGVSSRVGVVKWRGWPFLSTLSRPFVCL